MMNWRCMTDRIERRHTPRVLISAGVPPRMHSRSVSWLIILSVRNAEAPLRREGLLSGLVPLSGCRLTRENSSVVFFVTRSTSNRLSRTVSAMQAWSVYPSLSERS